MKNKLPLYSAQCTSTDAESCHKGAAFRIRQPSKKDLHWAHSTAYKWDSFVIGRSWWHHFRTCIQTAAYIWQVHAVAKLESAGWWPICRILTVLYVQTGKSARQTWLPSHSSQVSVYCKLHYKNESIPDKGTSQSPRPREPADTTFAQMAHLGPSPDICTTRQEVPIYQRPRHLLNDWKCKFLKVPSTVPLHNSRTLS